MHVLLVANTAASMVWFRLPLLRDLVARGHHVWVAAPRGDGVREIVATGASFLPLFETQGWAPDAAKDARRSYINPLVDLDTARAIRRACRVVRPDVVLTYTHKMTVLGAAAARAAGVPKVHGMITGLGFAHLGGSTRREVRRRVYYATLQAAGALCDSLIVLNQDNLDDARRLRLAPPERLYLMDGEGVDTELFESRAPTPPAGEATFLMVGRLVWHKGVGTFVEAARRVHQRYPGARFVVAGDSDPKHPDAIPAEKLDAWRREGIVNLVGFVKDIRGLYARSDVFVLPSGATEGLPVSILEGMAMARPILTTRAPGNRETVEEGVNGWLFDEGDVAALAGHMERLLSDPATITSMGQASRVRCESRFDHRIVNGRLMAHLGL